MKGLQNPYNSSIHSSKEHNFDLQSIQFVALLQASDYSMING
jgi:hypothetical protein